jgi:hypothetical protein
MVRVSPRVVLGTAYFVLYDSSLLGDRLAVGCLALNQETKVRPLLPELGDVEVVLIRVFAPGSSLLVRDTCL